MSSNDFQIQNKLMTVIWDILYINLQNLQNR